MLLTPYVRYQKLGPPTTAELIVWRRDATLTARCRVGAIMDFVEWVLSRVALVPFGLLISLGITISAVLSIIAVGRNQRFEKIRPQGGTRFVADTLQTTILGLILATAGIGIITTLKEDVPPWLSFGVPLLASLFAVVLAMGQLAPRGSFSWSRFWNIVFVPIMSTVIPMGAAAMRHMPDQIRNLFF